jgi:hypothetical protein
MNLDQLHEATMKQPLTPDAVKARDTKDAEALVKKALAKLRKATKYVFHVDQGFGWDSDKPNVYGVTVQTDIPEYFIDELETLVYHSDRATKVSSKVYPGDFDWASDTYIKDAAFVSFKF